jgi:hypothetical protein
MQVRRSLFPLNFCHAPRFGCAYMERGTLHDGENIPCSLLHVKENRLKLVASSIYPNDTRAMPIERYYPHPSFESC